MIMKINKICVLLIFTLVILSVFLVGCSVKTTLVPPAAGEKLKVVTTTSFVGDVVGVIAGQEVELIVLLEPGQNPHAYQTAPQDMVNVSEADLIFVNGLGLEEFLDDLIAGTGNTAAMIMVSDGIFPWREQNRIMKMRVKREMEVILAVIRTHMSGLTLTTSLFGRRILRVPWQKKIPRMLIPI